MQEPESVLTSLFSKDMAGMKRSILGILELIAVAGSSTVERVTAKRRCELRGGGGGEEEGEVAGAGGDVDWRAQIKRESCQGWICR